MFENIVVSLSNLYGYLPYSVTENQFDSLLISGMVLASSLYHLFEHHKHGLEGFSRVKGLRFLSSRKAHQIFINVDRFFAVAVFFRFFDVKLLAYSEVFIPGIVGLSMLFSSEIIFKESVHKKKYVITHSLWHILAFHTVYNMIKFSKCSILDSFYENLFNK